MASTPRVVTPLAETSPVYSPSMTNAIRAIKEAMSTPRSTQKGARALLAILDDITPTPSTPRPASSSLPTFTERLKSAVRTGARQAATQAKEGAKEAVSSGVKNIFSSVITRVTALVTSVLSAVLPPVMLKVTGNIKE